MSNPFSDYVNALSESARSQIKEREGDYRDNDNILHCGTCNAPREAYISAMGCNMPIPCVCEQTETINQRNAQTIAKNREDCFLFHELFKATFENDKNFNPDITKRMREYVENFETYRKDGTGLLLYGPVGSGKSFHAYQVANALIDKLHRVKACTFEELYRGIPEKNKNDFYRHLTGYSLVVLDDLDAESKSSTMRTFVTTVIDTLYKAKTPFIITTNISWVELTTTPDGERQRIFSRILERCNDPIFVTGNVRAKIAKEKSKEYKTMLGID